MFDGKSIERMPAYKICREGIARTFQTETDFETLSLLDNVKLGTVFGHGTGLSEAESMSLAIEMLQFVGLTDDYDQPSEDISVFDKKRLMIASALGHPATLAVVGRAGIGPHPPRDPRYREADPQTQRSRGWTILLIEHVLPLLLTVSHRLMVLNFGQVLAEGDPQEVVKNEEVIEAYLGRRSDDE